MEMVCGKRDVTRWDAKGFTLVELLVVISIICLLVSISLPALSQAQQQAEQVHCLANQHQLMLAWFVYATEHDDKLCEPLHWTSALESGTQLKKVMICKAEGDEAQGVSYAVSNTMGGDARDGVSPFIWQHQISQTSRMVVFVDKNRDSSTCFWPVLREDDRWLWRPWSWPPGLQGMTNRHNNGYNAAYADGHGEHIRWKDPRTRKLIEGLIADPNQASGGNSDLQEMVASLAGRWDVGGD